MKPAIRPEIRKYFDKKAYLNKALQLIRADFEMSACPFSAPESDVEDLPELVSLVKENITPLMKENGYLLKNLLYRIDVPEKMLHREMASRPGLQLEDLIVQKIIEREMLKVLTREKYSS